MLYREPGGAVPLGLIVTGIGILGLWLLFLSRFEESKTRPGFWRRRSTQAGTNALIATLAVLAILGLINFLGARYVWRLDLTENQIFTLSPETQQLVRSLKQPVKVWLFDPQQSSQDRELLASYRRLSPQLSYEFVNPNAQPSLVERLEVKKPGDVIVEVPATSRKQFVQSVNEQERLSEAKLTNAIAQVTGTRQATVYFVQGHGERSIEESQEAMAQAAKALQDRGYTVKPFNLVKTATFPKDARVVVLAGPQKALLKPEVDALNNFVKQGGNLLVMVDPNVDPGLDSLLAPWGITLGPWVVIDASGRAVNLGPTDVTVTRYGDHPITREFGNSLSFYSAARPVDVKQIPGITATPLLFTGDFVNDRVWAESDLKKQPVQFDAQSDRQGPLVLGFALSRPIGDPPKPSPSPSPTVSPGAKASPSPSPSPSPNADKDTASKKEARLVVIGNSSFVADGYFNQVINGDVFLNSVRWLSQEEQQTLSIRPKEAKNRRITLNSQQANLIAWLSLVILPLIGFGTAATVWWKRR
ncbi:GldG family protein [Leptothermofonsia sp. ETS-13]|uniref:GldG family protein n=1 Tax=Leptothermofonsia sp. ETS-13 TaxID=3035696 RepID=UPI003B9F5DD2